MRRHAITICGVVLTVLVSTAVAKPGGHVTEERREYYHKSSKVLDTPVQYFTDGSGSYSSGNSALRSTWAQNHMDDVQKMAEKLKSEYNSQALGGSQSRYQSRQGFSGGSSFEYPSFTGKSQEQLDILARDMTEKMIADMRSGKIVYSQISQPNWFEGIAAQRLEALSHRQSQNQNYESQNTEDLQQQTQDVFGAEDLRQAQQSIGGGYQKTTEKKHYEYSSSHGGYQPVPTYATEVENLNQHEEKSSVVYPTTITIIGGKRYVTRQNCSSSSTIGSRAPYYSNFQSQSNFDRRTQENERNVPVVVGQTQSTYDKEDTSYNKQRENAEVPVYPGSYFTDDQYDSQYSQTHDGKIPIQSQVHGESTQSHESSQRNHQYTIPVGGSQTVSTSSSSVHEREHQRIPVVIPTQQTVGSSSESYSQSETQRQIPVVYPSGSIHRESSSYESVRDKQIPVRPVPTSSQHSIYKHLQKESEFVPNYKPEVIIDTQMMETMSQQANRYYPQRTSTVVQGHQIEQEEKDRQVQQNVVIPEMTLTIHEQESNENLRNKYVQPTRPTTSTSQQTVTDERQQTSVSYRPSYPAYGSQVNRNDSEYHQTYESRHPQQHTDGSSYDSEEYYREGQQQIPIFGQTSQTVEETNQTDYRSRENQAPVVVGGSTYREDQEEYTEEGQKQVPVYQGFETSEEDNRTVEYTGQRTRPIYIGGSSQVTETEDEGHESHRYKYPEHQTARTTSQTEESYWSRHHSRPGSVQTGQTETDDYRESSRTRYPQGVSTSQTTHEEETSGLDIHRQRPGYSVTTQFNETTSTSASGSAETSQTPKVIAGNEQTILEVGTDEDTQFEQRPGYGSLEIETEQNETSFGSHGEGRFRSGSGYNRESSGQDYEQHQQRPGGIQFERTEYGSEVNRNYTSGGGLNIGYITHQLTVEQQEEEWRRQQEERRRQQRILEESSLNQTSSYDNMGGGQVQINIEPQGIHDGDEKPRPQKPLNGINMTSSSAACRSSAGSSVVSKDRGDQPPQQSDDDCDMGEAEPGIGYYPSEPELVNQRAEPTTPKYEPQYVAPLAPLPVDDVQSSVAPGETEVQRTYHRKKTTITSTIPVLIGPNGEVIQESSGSLNTDTRSRESLAGGNYQTQQTSGSLSSGSLTQQHESSGSYGTGSGAYESSSSSHQSGGRRGSYGTSNYGSQTQYNSGTTDQSGADRSRYSTGSSSTSTSYRNGGSFSQATAFGHQQQESEEDQGQLTVGGFEVGGQQIEDLTQQSEDLTQQSLDLTQQTEDLTQQSEDFDEDLTQQSQDFAGELTQQGEDLTQQSEDLTQQSVDFQKDLADLAQREQHSSSSHGSYSSQSSWGTGRGQQQERDAGSHSSSHYQSQGSSSGSSSRLTTDHEEEIPATVEEVKTEEVVTAKPGFWSRIGKKAKDILG